MTRRTVPYFALPSLRVSHGLLRSRSKCRYPQALQGELATMSERENKFLDWLVTKEFPKHDLKIKYFPTVGTNALHRGLTSTVDKRRGDVLLRIPSSCSCQSCRLHVLK